MSRMQPAERSVSSVSHCSSCEPMTVETFCQAHCVYAFRITINAIARYVIFSKLFTQRFPSTRITSSLISPPLASSFIIPNIPPARLHSCRLYFCVFGANLHRQGTLRLSSSMSDMVNQPQPLEQQPKDAAPYWCFLPWLCRVSWHSERLHA